MKIYLTGLVKQKKKSQRKTQALKSEEEVTIRDEKDYKKSTLLNENENVRKEAIIYSLRKRPFRTSKKQMYEEMWKEKLEESRKLKDINHKNLEHSVMDIEKDTEKRIRTGAKGNHTKEREKKKKVWKGLNPYHLPKSYYVLLFFMIALASVSSRLVWKEYKKMNQEEYAVFEQEDPLAVDVFSEEKSNQNEQSSNADTRQELEKKEEMISSSTNTSQNTMQQVQNTIEKMVQPKEEYLIFSKPLNGEITKIYSDDKVIYSKTLEMWKTHDGIDVAAELDTPVYAIERGTIEKVYEDAFYGTTIVINHGQGYKSSYSNLGITTEVKQGDSIKKGKKIGVVGNTAIGEIKDLPHLHFMLYENNQIIDPSSIFE